MESGNSYGRHSKLQSLPDLRGVKTQPPFSPQISHTSMKPSSKKSTWHLHEAQESPYTVTDHTHQSLRLFCEPHEQSFYGSKLLLKQVVNEIKAVGLSL